MNTNISIEFSCIINLYNTSVWHRDNCLNGIMSDKQETCNISLFLLKEAAGLIMEGLNSIERQEAANLINKWPR